MRSSALHKRGTTSSINLFKGKGRSFIDRFIKWALSIGRFIIILTEVIALSAFLYRFSLDRNLIDLNDQIKNEETRLNILKANEEKYRNLQDRITTIGKLSDEATYTISTLTNFIGSIPPDMSFKNMQYTTGILTMSGSVSSASSLASFIRSLKADPKIKNVRLERIENKISSSTLLFSVYIVFNK